MDQVRVLRIVVASPGDVKPERDIVPKVVEEVNRNIARERGLHLEVRLWETDSFPGFHPDGPQGLIDSLLKIQECDILIAIFWKRFGTPVKGARSGTEHEFLAAYEAWQKNRKPQIMVYFSQKDSKPRSKQEADQWGLVLQFKEEFPPEGLWSDYEDEADFERQVRNHLSVFLTSKFPAQGPEAKQPEPHDPAKVVAPSLTPLHQLPPPPADFTGRTAELAELRAAIEKGGVHISGLQGQGGVGKTALALKLAAELAPNYPDAQIYLDLKGVSEKPLTAAEAMSHVLRTFDREAKLPEKEEDLRALYLSALHNKRALLLMDNAKDAAQAKPLIPPLGCALLVTSRQHFALPGLQAKNLETLPPPDAKDLLLRIAPRIDGEAETIAKLCGYLPQALRLAASAIAVRVNLEPQDYARQLADEKKRLELLAGDDESVTASITLSYNLLDAATQKRWRMLAVFRDTFDVPAAAAVWEIEGDAAEDTLGRLFLLSMLEWNDSTKRYRLHDLMRDFARKRLTPAESDAASRRHARHYLRVLDSARNVYKAGGESIMPGLALFDLEWGNIQAGQTWSALNAATHDEAAMICSDYPDVGAFLLLLRQHPRAQIRWRDAALAAARQLGDRAAEGRHLGMLGYSFDDLGEYHRAIEYYETFLTITREIGNRREEGIGLGLLGVAYKNLGERRRAIEYHEKHLAIARETADRGGEGNALGNLGNVHADLGELRRAIEYYEQTLAIAREIGDRQVEGNALACLGGAHNDLGESHRAIEYHEQSLAIACDIGDRRVEGNAMWNMSLTLYKLGDREKAIEHAETSLKIREEIEDPSAAMVRKQLDIWRKS
ncbi:MAG TPA: tetratricopeptide repeat protein [Candidatus Dormibacteraeota bacterium]|jgi:tetratricopeptide (TPR) repeat protein|nr:tetratricopeptide repeat protein [Candidatus Dormibacteraeota bacterium]